MKTIAIDATGLSHSRPTGVEVATRDLIQALVLQDKVNRFVLYAPEALPANFELGSNTQVRILPRRMFWAWRAIGSALKQDRPDVFWAPANYLPPNLPSKVIATIHDLAFIHYPELYKKKDLWLQRFSLNRAVKYATKLVAISEATKQDIINAKHVDPNRITVIHHGLPATRVKYAEGEKELSLPTDFALVVGRVEPKKNTKNIILGFAEMSAKYPNLHLVFAGFPGRDFDKITTLVKELGLESRILFFDFVSPGNLTQLYHQAKMLLYPSLYEGFGFVILEGFSSRVPVITSNFGAMAEVAGDAAYLVDPRKPYDIGTAIDTLMSDFALRTKLVSLGEARVKEFSWVKAANQMIDLINSL